MINMQLNNKIIVAILISIIFSQSPPKDMLGTSFDLLNEYYIDSIDQVKIIESAINGLTEPLDPYTKLLIDDSKDSYDRLRKGQYGGIGIRIGSLKDTLTVLSTMEGGPAIEIGLKSGDQIIAVDQNSVIGKTTSDASKLIKGELGTLVNLTIKRPGLKEILFLNIKRAKINLNNIGYTQIDENLIGYIKINKFSKNVSKDFVQSLRELNQELFVDENGNNKWDSAEIYRDSNNNGQYDTGERYVDKNKNGSWDPAEIFIDINGNSEHDDFGRLNGLVIDLRGNTGGLLSEAKAILDALIKGNEIILYTKGRNGKILKTFRSSKNAPVLPANIPVVVLVNNQSASASEIVSGTIQDLDRGVIVGKTTFGKGLVQKIKHLNDTTSLKITYAKYYTPSGRLIQKQDWLDNGILTDGKDMKDSVFYTIKNKREVKGGGGISPDVMVELTETSPYIRALWKENLFLAFTIHYLSNEENYNKFNSRLSKSINKYMEVDEKAIDYIFTPALIPDYPLGITESMINRIDIIDSTENYKCTN